MVVRLTRRRRRDAGIGAQVDDLGEAPGTIVADAEITHLADADQVGDHSHRLSHRRVGILFVQIVDVDVVGAEARQAFVDRAQQPLARQAASVRPVAHRVRHLGGQHPAVAIAGDEAAGDFLGGATDIGVGGVDEVDPGVARHADHERRGRLVGRPPEGQGSETKRRHLESGVAERTVLHARPSRGAVTPAQSRGGSGNS